MRAALLGTRRIGLRAHCLKPGGRCRGPLRNLIHLLRTHALLGLQLPVAIQRAGRKFSVGLCRRLLVLRGLHARLRLLRRSAQGRVVEYNQRLSRMHAVSLANQHLLNAAHNLSGDHGRLSRVNGSRGAHVQWHLLLLALNHPRLCSLYRSGCSGFVAVTTGHQRREDGKQTTREHFLHCKSSAASGVSVPVAYSSSA